MRKAITKLVQQGGLIAAILLVSGVMLSPLRALGDTNGGGTGGVESGGGGSYLQQIAQNTLGILNEVNNLPTYLQQLVAFAQSWASPDDSDATAQLQSTISTWSTATQQENGQPLTYLKSLQYDFFGPLQTTNTNQPQTTTTKQAPANVDNLAYSSFLGTPYSQYAKSDSSTNPPAPTDAAYKYIQNASGINISHIKPAAGWQGSATDWQNYSNYYDAISAIQTYNAYLFSQAYTDAKNGTPLNTLQTSLLQQASQSGWFSQVYVMLTRLVQIQQQALATQATNNSLLVLLNLSQEHDLIGYAKGVR